jgi:hypothetical protein
VKKLPGRSEASRSRRLPVATMSMFFEPHRLQTSRLRQAMIVIEAP